MYMYIVHLQSNKYKHEAGVTYLLHAEYIGRCGLFKMNYRNLWPGNCLEINVACDFKHNQLNYSLNKIYIIL